MMKILDTDLLIGILRGKKEAVDYAKKLDKEGRQATTVINVFELYYGLYSAKIPLKTRMKRIKGLESLLSRLDIMILEQSDAKLAAEIAGKLRLIGKPIEIRDVLIAAIAINRKLPVVTRNIKHFERIAEINKSLIIKK